MEEVVVVKAIRTPFGNFGGTLKDIPAVHLGGMIIRKLLEDVPVADNEIDYLLMGCTLPGNGTSPARQASIDAGLPLTVNSLTIERACCSSMHAIGLAFDAISNGKHKIVIAGGCENMSSTPYLVPQMRWGQRLGDITVYDDLIIRNPYLKAPMAQYSGEVALEWGVSREELDRWALKSNMTAIAAQKNGWYKDEIIPVEVETKKGTITFDRDEHPRADTSLEKLAKLKLVYGSPAITGGNASALSDGASGLLLMSRSEAEKRGIKPLARVIDHLAVSGEPRSTPVLPGVGIEAILAKNSIALDDIKLIEINEAFASMPTVSTLYLAGKDRKKCDAIREITNVNGGAIAIGHPLGASGARVFMTGMHELRRRGERLGAFGICGAMGQGDICLVEALY